MISMMEIVTAVGEATYNFARTFLTEEGIGVLLLAFGVLPLAFGVHYLGRTAQKFMGGDDQTRNKARVQQGNLPAQNAAQNAGQQAQQAQQAQHSQRGSTEAWDN